MCVDSKTGLRMNCIDLIIGERENVINRYVWINYYVYFLSLHSSNQNAQAQIYGI